jgi:hypothetical protein
VALLVGAGLLVALIAAGAWALSDRSPRETDGLAPTPIAEAPEGERVKLVGVVEPDGEPLRAPLSGRSCAYYAVLVEEGHEGPIGTWRTVAREQAGRRFRLRDASGSALVELQGANATAVEDRRWLSGVYHPLRPELAAFLERHGQKPTGLLLPRRLRYIEGTFVFGAQVTVVGTARWEPDPAPPPGSATGYRQAPTRLVVRASADAPLRVTNRR